MTSGANTVEEYLESLDSERRKAVEALRETILQNLDEGFVEGIQYGHIGYFVPHSTYPAGYHCDPRQPLPFMGIASQKHHIALHSYGLYGSSPLMAWFQEAWAKSGKKLDMGKACVRFKNLDGIALDVIGELVARQSLEKYVAAYEKALRR
jgi:hypothetical protein